MHILFYIVLLLVLYNNYVIYKYTSQKDVTYVTYETDANPVPTPTVDPYYTSCSNDTECPIGQDLYRRNLYTDNYACFEGLCTDLDWYKKDFLENY